MLGFGFVFSTLAIRLLLIIMCKCWKTCDSRVGKYYTYYGQEEEQSAGDFWVLGQTNNMWGTDIRNKYSYPVQIFLASTDIFTVYKYFIMYKYSYCVQICLLCTNILGVYKYSYHVQRFLLCMKILTMCKYSFLVQYSFRVQIFLPCTTILTAYKCYPTQITIWRRVCGRW